MGMFEGMIEKTTLWEAVRAAHALVTESRVFIDDKGWHIKAIDRMSQWSSLMCLQRRSTSMS